MEWCFLLSVVNHLYKTLKVGWPKAIKRLAALHIQEELYHGSHFAGNECYKLINNLDLLQQLAEKDSAFQVFGFVETFQKFQAVVSLSYVYLIWHKN